MLRESVPATLGDLRCLLERYLTVHDLRSVSERMLFILQFNRFHISGVRRSQTTPDLVRPTALDDVLVEGEHHVRRELSRPCVKVLGQSVLSSRLFQSESVPVSTSYFFEKSSCVLSERNSNIVSSSMPNFSSATLGCPLRNEVGTSKERRFGRPGFCTDPWKNHLLHTLIPSPLSRR